MVERGITVNIVEQLIKADRTHPRRIMVVGDRMTDIYVEGTLSDCQDGCKKFVSTRRVTVLGGSANAARSLTHWSCVIQFFGGQGRTTKTRFMVEGQCVFRYDDDHRDIMLSDVRNHILGIIRFGQIHGVLLSDYDKGFLSPEFIHDCAQLCREKGIPCVADCKRNMRLYEGCIRKGNRDYWGSYPLPHDAVATCGSVAPSVGNEVIECNLPPIPCVNHVGAGDCFSAHLTLGLTYGLSLKDAATVAHSAGRVYVQFPHNRPPTPAEVAADMGQAVAASS